MFDFQNKVVLVTGASSGIGAATTIAFVEAGAKVSMVGRNEAKLNHVAKMCEQKGIKPFIIIADVTKDAKRIIDDTVEHFGRLDVLINNAGVFIPTNIFDPNVMESYDRVINTNLRSTVQLTHLAVPHLIKTKGNIVNVSSVASMGILFNNSFGYGTSKAGMDYFSKSIAMELSKHGVRVNTVNPGGVKTDININAGMNKEQSDAITEVVAQSTPLKRVGEPEEIADVILFLASDKARSVTGSNYVSDNGALLKGFIELKAPAEE